MKFYLVVLVNIIVIYDDFDFEFGCIWFKIGGGEGGYNGLCLVVVVLGIKDF